MPGAITFDTLAYAKKLKSAGFTEDQAEIQAEALAEVVDERLATKEDTSALQGNIKESEISLRRDMKEMETSLKRDMKESETSLKRDIKELETSLKRDMKELEMRLTIRLGTMMAISIAIVATLVKLL